MSSGLPPPPCAAVCDSSDLTWVQVVRRGARLEHWIRFGKPCRTETLDGAARRLGFPPGAVFAYVRWQAHDVGDVRTRLDVLRAPGGSPGPKAVGVPGVSRPARRLLAAAGAPQVIHALGLIDHIEAQGIDPTGIPEGYWRRAEARLIAGLRPRPYAASRPAAGRRRRGAAA